ncbi:MAG TPA: choice-of-anchor Q domain-containing protein [Rudaea sp.]|nr:choice-of-anchor Q domain-containing protein [Rudaea sp.]
MKRELGFVVACALSAWILLAPATARAAPTFTVDSTLDQIDDDVTDGVCHTAAGTCTLRAAVMQANRMLNAGAAIVLPAETYVLTRGPLGADDETNGDLNLTAPTSGNPVITISGSGATTAIIDANGLDRIFNVDATRTAHVSGVTLRNGLVVAGSGGAIANAGVLVLDHCVISRNTGMSSDSYTSKGGGIYNSGTLQLTNVTLDHNEGDFGGAIYNSGDLSIDLSSLSNNLGHRNGGGITSDGGPLHVDRSTFTGNSSLYGGAIGGAGYINRSTLTGNSAFYGGAIDVAAATYIVNSTLAGNTADRGGAIYAGADVSIFNSTVVYNQVGAGGQGAGIYNAAGTAAVHNTILAGNVITGNVLPEDNGYEDCWGALNAYGNNRFSDTTGAFFSNCQPTQVGTGMASNITSYSELGALQNNGGPTPTYALVSPSDMIDGTDPAVACVDGYGNPLLTDQRGDPRVFGVRCDIGAFEYDDTIFRNGFE